MEKRKWLWKRKSSERSPGETESSGSISSHSERYSDDQSEAFKASPNQNIQSPEVTSKAIANGEDVNDSFRNLTEKLSAALVNVSAKDDLVKQHAKVAEEAVAGWEKAENEMAVFKQKLEAAVQQNSALEHRVSHLDGALKECVRQLRQAREEQEQKIHEAVMKKTHEWESTKFELESQLLELQSRAEAITSEPPARADPGFCQKLESLEKENSALKLELLSQSEELEIRTIERDLSTEAAETASKQHLESIKKVAKLEAECRRLKALACKSSLVNDHRSTTASSIYVESLTDSQSDSGERLNAVEIDTRKMYGLEQNKYEPSYSDSWASALIAELDQFKNEKAVNKNLSTSSIDIDLMDDFLEMERLAALPEMEHENRQHESDSAVKKSNDAESSLRAELEAMINRTAGLEEKFEKMEAEKAELVSEFSAKQSNEAETLLRSELEAMIHQTSELEEKMEKMEAEKAELEMALNQSQENFEASQVRLREVETKLEDLQKELHLANESKQLLESQLINMEVEGRTMSTKINSLEADVQKERTLSAQTAVKYQELEEELSRTKQEVELRQIAHSNDEPKIKQEDLAVAAGKLAECQKTIASLGQQLQSLATLEDFLIDTASIPGLSVGGTSIPSVGGEPWKLHSNETFSPKKSNCTKMACESSGPSVNKNDGNSPLSCSSSTSSAVSSNHVSSEKNRNGFAKFFTRSKNGIQLEI